MDAGTGAEFTGLAGPSGRRSRNGSVGRGPANGQRHPTTGALPGGGGLGRGGATRAHNPSGPSASAPGPGGTGPKRRVGHAGFDLTPGRPEPHPFASGNARRNDARPGGGQ